MRSVLAFPVIFPMADVVREGDDPPLHEFVGFCNPVSGFTSVRFAVVVAPVSATPVRVACFLLLGDFLL